MSNCSTITGEKSKVPIKIWDGNGSVPVEDGAKEQLKMMSELPFIHKHIAVMSDCHWGNGACVGSVIPTVGAIIPAAVGVDLGCGITAVRTSLRALDLPDNLKNIRSRVESEIPHGRTADGGRGDCGAWGNPPTRVLAIWGNELGPKFQSIVEKYPHIEKSNNIGHLGTLGTGNHFIEICLDESDYVWFMLHSGSRGVGARIGDFFINKAKEEMERWFIHLPDKNLAYLAEGSQYFDDYVEAVEWAQHFASWNRKIMMENVIKSVQEGLGGHEFESKLVTVDCHHNYIARENHFGRNVWITRKGAVRARKDDLGIIPGSMGVKSFIVRGQGNNDSFHSCSHGAGRKMSRTAAKAKFTLDDHIQATKHIECRKDKEVIDETPMAYKDIDVVMTAQSDLVEIVHKLSPLLCVKG